MSAPIQPSGNRSGTTIGIYVAFVALFGVAAAAGLAAAAAGQPWGPPVATGGLVGVAALGASLPLALLLLRRPDVADPRVARLLEEQNRLLAQIHEHTLLSDGSKRLIYRNNELQLLRQAIEEDIARGDYDAAVTLCTTMAEQFGFREEAEGFRDSIESSRSEQRARQVRDATRDFDDALGRHDWAAARQEAARIRRLFPEEPVVEELDRRIDEARGVHRQELEERFLAAANHGETEHAMQLLRELDRSLSREDAARIREVAGTVIARHRENLGVQFHIAVRDRNWAEAVRIGNDIVREFPNGKMAEEVRSMLELLQTRATQAAVNATGSEI